MQPAESKMDYWHTARFLVRSIYAISRLQYFDACRDMNACSLPSIYGYAVILRNNVPILLNSTGDSAGCGVGISSDFLR